MAGALIVAGLVRPGASRAPSEEELLARSPRAPALSRIPGAAPRGPARAEGSAAAPEGEDRDLWQRRLSRAQQTLDAYRKANRYPPGSRPASEHPDEMQPHHVAPVTLPLARDDRKLTDAKVTLGQDRYFLVGDERVTFSIGCATSEGPATCEIQRATASVPADVKDAGARPAATVTFSAGEGRAMRAALQPGAEGFAGYHGPIHVDMTVAVAGETGGASFEIVYAPAAPAVFTGHVREALEQGSLGLYVEMDVTEPGRYVLAARVDDADGRSFAYLSFNEELAAGRQEARFTLSGKLVRDEGARSPFRLRDVEGFRLIPDAYPDRVLMPAIEGPAYTTKTYTLRDFSDDEWQSEEKDRHLKELTKDVDEAKGHAEGP